MNSPGFSAEASLDKSDEPYRVSRIAFNAIAQVTPQNGSGVVPKATLCAVLFEACVTRGLCEDYFAHCPGESGGGGGGDGAGGGGRRGPIRFA